MNAHLQGSTRNGAARPWMRRALLAAKIGVTASVFAFLLTNIDLASAFDAMLRVPLPNLLLMLVVAYLGVGLAAVRWRIVLRICGADRRPPLTRLLRLMLVTVFYNTLPGAIGGEIVRGYATAECFDQSGLTRALGVSLLDRLFGLAGLLLLTAVAFMFSPLPGVGGVFAVAGAGAAAIAMAVVSLMLAPRLGRLLPLRLERLVAQLPELRSPLGMLPALLLSIGTQTCAVFTGYVLLLPLAPDTITFGIALVVLPLASAAAYFPLSIGGAGAREAVLVVLLSMVGVPEGVALAVGLLLLAGLVFVAATGGVVSLVTPLRAGEDREVAPHSV